MSPEKLVPSLTLEPTSCGLCGSDEAEPVAVGEDFRGRTSRDTYLAVRCSTCGLIYLTPAPASGSLPAVQLPGRESLAGACGRLARPAVRRAVQRWARRLPADTTVVTSGPPDPDVLESLLAPTARLRAVALDDERLEPGSAAGALLIEVLEHRPSPLSILEKVRPVLRPDGRVLIITTNPACLAAVVFRGRDWSGYDFPRHRALTDPATLRRLAARAGFVTDTLWTIGDPGAWLVSTGNLAGDWRRFGWLARALERPSGPIGAIGRGIERVSTWAGRGGLLAAILRPITVAGGPA